MSIFSKLFGKKKEQKMRIGGMEDFMSLIRVYYQSVMALQLGISNLSALPDLRTFKTTLKVATVNNRLGVGERAKCRKMLTDIYGMSDEFFKEIDLSIKHGCKSVNDVRTYFIQFQDFSQNIMMVLSNEMRLKLRLPSFFKNALRGMIEKKIHEILTKTDWSDESVRRTCIAVRQYQQRLGYSEQWIKEYATCIIMLAKKEPAPADESEK
ncbi:MAG: hypothetical protein HUK01_00815 [Bacteroidaceae bacterium]|nr:hypothetical protein [Bacteroidaceae bacterium]